jgi:RHS repeat-associated protein
MDDPSTTTVTEGFGLMFYVSRMYDPALGRFAQADSIVPPGVQGWDRYAAINNDPVRYTDPSGHISCDELPEGECGVGTPTPRPNDLSNVPGDRTSISGNDFYNWYRELWNTPGWWWEVFGQAADGFTVFDAIAVIMFKEAFLNWTDPYLIEAVIRKANYWCGGPCTTGGFINWFAHYSQTVGGFVRSGTAPGDPRKGISFTPSFNSTAQNALNHLAASFTNYDSSWGSGCVDDRPCGWGNSSIYPWDVQNHLNKNQNRFFTYVPPKCRKDEKCDPWFIPSGCVNTHWLDPTYRDLFYGCAPVP